MELEAATLQGRSGLEVGRVGWEGGWGRRERAESREQRAESRKQIAVTCLGGEGREGKGTGNRKQETGTGSRR
jgi:hypothetical protein